MHEVRTKGYRVCAKFYEEYERDGKRKIFLPKRKGGNIGI